MSEQQFTDEALVSHFYAGDQTGLRDLFDRYKNKLFFYGYCLTQDRQQASGLVANVFKQICQKKYVELISPPVKIFLIKNLHKELGAFKQPAIEQIDVHFSQLNRMPLLLRQVVLLKQCVQLSDIEIAKVLDSTEAKVRLLLLEAGKHFKQANLHVESLANIILTPEEEGFIKKTFPYVPVEKRIYSMLKRQIIFIALIITVLFFILPLFLKKPAPPKPIVQENKIITVKLPDNPKQLQEAVVALEKVAYNKNIGLQGGGKVIEVNTSKKHVVEDDSFDNLKRYLQEQLKPPPEAVNIHRMVNAFSYTNLEPEILQPLTVKLEGTPTPWNPLTRTVMVSLSAPLVLADALKPNNVVFLIDLSGSMVTGDKISMVKKALINFTDALQAEDTVAIVVYGGTNGVVLPPTHVVDKDKILTAIDRLEEGGSFEEHIGLFLAYDVLMQGDVTKSNNRVVLMTDDNFDVCVCSNNDIQTLIETNNQQGNHLDVLGFNLIGYKDERVDQWAKKGGGYSAFIHDQAQLEEVLNLYVREQQTLLPTDIKVKVDFNSANVKAFQRLNAKEPLLDNENLLMNKQGKNNFRQGYAQRFLYEYTPLKDTLLPDEKVLTVTLTYKDARHLNNEGVVQYDLYERDLALNPSVDFTFVLGLTEFGLALRDDLNKAGATEAHGKELMQKAVGTPPRQDRVDFINLINTGN